MNKRAIAVLYRNNSTRSFVANVSKHKIILLMLVPAIIYFIIFQYLPIYGNIIAFKDFSFSKGIFGGEWVGLKYFNRLFESEYFWRAFKNTIIINFYRIVFAFPVPIILAIIINEIRNKYFKSTFQIISFIPHFLSWVVVAGVLYNFLNLQTGTINLILKEIGLEPVMFMASPKYFRGVVIISDIWKNMGWSSIMYTAAICSLDNNLFEAADIDGARRWQKILYITLPGIMSTIVVLLLLQVAAILTNGFDQIFVMYNPLVYNVSDILDTYMYREGIQNAQISYAAALGLFKSLFGLVLFYLADRFAKLVGQPGII